MARPLPCRRSLGDKFNRGTIPHSIITDPGHTRFWRVPDTESTRFWSRVGVIQFQLMLQATGVWVQLQTAAYSAGVR